MGWAHVSPELPATMPTPTPDLPTDYSLWDDDADSGALPSAAPLPPPAVAVSDAAGMVHLRVAEVDHGVRLDKWLAGQLPDRSRNRLQEWIEAGAVRVNGVPATIRQPVRGGDAVEVEPRPTPESQAFVAEPVPLVIVYQDDAILVVNKPPGLVVHPAAGNWTGTLQNGLLYLDPRSARLARAGIVHRLDKDTSGLMVVARTEAAQLDLIRQLQARTVRREYLAVVLGHPPERGSIDAPIGRHPRERTRMAVFSEVRADARAAVTHFRVLARALPVQGSETALLACRLETGRTHQIRVHLQHLGFPLVGDAVYGPGGRRAHTRGPQFGRQALHAWRLGLIHPSRGDACFWEAAPPDDLQGLLDTLGLVFNPAEGRTA